jgi:hypothetical protein
MDSTGHRTIPNLNKTPRLNGPTVPTPRSNGWELRAFHCVRLVSIVTDLLSHFEVNVVSDVPNRKVVFAQHQTSAILSRGSDAFGPTSIFNTWLLSTDIF